MYILILKKATLEVSNFVSHFLGVKFLAVGATPFTYTRLKQKFQNSATPECPDQRFSLKLQPFLLVGRSIFSAVIQCTVVAIKK